VSDWSKGQGVKSMPREPDSMDEVADLMRENLPAGMSPAEFGKRMNWGRGSAEAEARMPTITIGELERIGLGAEQATNWAIAYEAVVRLMPDNPSAAGRARLMRHAARLLARGK